MRCPLIQRLSGARRSATAPHLVELRLGRLGERRVGDGARVVDE